MSDDRICIRGCTKRGIHYATCELSGPDYDGAFPCTGCAPKECREGSFWCDTCFGRARRLLDDGPDLVARLWSLVDPTKATPLDQVRVRVTSSDPADVVAANPLDARIAVVQVLADWSQWNGDLHALSNDKAAAEWFGPRILDRHPPHKGDGGEPWKKGTREAWSLQDAIDAYPVERVPAKGEHPWEPDEDAEEESVSGIPELDALITSADAAKLAHITESTLRRWVQAGMLEPRARLREGRKVTAYYYRSEVRAAAKKADETRHAARPPKVLAQDARQFQ